MHLTDVPGPESDSAPVGRAQLPMPRLAQELT